jgi:hypothetical protein
MKKLSVLLFMAMMGSALAQAVSVPPLSAPPTDPKYPDPPPLPFGPSKGSLLPDPRTSKLPPSPLPASKFANPIEQQILSLQKRVVALEDAIEEIKKSLPPK